MNPVVQQLLQAKKHSDKSQYQQKAEILRVLLKKHPSQFKIDSRQTSTVGLTHKPSGFKIHTPKGNIPLEYIQYHNQMQKAAAFYGSMIWYNTMCQYIH